MKRRVLSLGCNLLITLMVALTWHRLLRITGGSGRLSAAGLASLKYFTVLSNLGQGAVSAAWTVCLARVLLGRAAEMPRALRMMKYTAAVCVSLTFLTVAVFLGHLYGYASMFAGINLWFHLIVPLAAALDYCVLDREGVPSLRDSRRTLLPVLAYAAGYIANLLANGIGRGQDTNDWYGFAAGGPAMAAAALCIVLLGSWLIALALRLPRAMKGRRRNG